MKKYLIYLTILASSVIFLSCYSYRGLGGFSDTSEPSEKEEEIISYVPDEIVSSWRVVSMRADERDKLITPPRDIVPTINIRKSGRAGGFSGCNTYGGIVSVDGNSLFFSNRISTLKGCVKEFAMDIEKEFGRALDRINNYSTDREKLILKKDSDVLLILTKY